MAHSAKSPLSNDGFLTVLGVIAGVCAAVFDQWAARTIFVLLGMALIVYAGRRHGSHPLVRYPVAIGALALFAFLPWASIWADFHKDFPTTNWPKFIEGARFHWALVTASSLILIWNWRPVWNVRRRAIFSWRMTVLGEETWIGRDSALKIIRGSDWAQIREPAFSMIEQLAQSMRFSTSGKTEYDRDLLRFNRFIAMTLESFERNNPSAVREVDGKKEYAEGVLRTFMDNALDDEVIQRFGQIPS